MILAAVLSLALGVEAPPPKPAENRLAGSKSRYLLQHATNPVDWYPWGDEAWARARKENKPVFLSIGYSTCHWCKVMESESFSDREIAAQMNAAFVSIKVDREERPDLDAVYLGVARTLTGEAGWPNNVVLTPDGKPFLAMAYVPKEKFRALIRRVSEMWGTQPELVVANADMIVRSIAAETAQPAEVVAPELFEKGYRQLAARFDAKHGGFLPAPKFPAPHQLMFLLRYWKRTGEPRALEMAVRTLTAMRAGALWDSRDFGFHRYASDDAWAEPHYEKMLYDQALLALAYLEAYQATQNAAYARTAREIFTFVLRDLRAPSGAFYAALDADEAYYRSVKRSRVRKPGRDEKVIADWNGLMIAALSQGAVVLGEPSYAAAAERAADAVTNKRRPYLDDYAFLTWGLLNLYEATFEIRHLRKAIAMSDEVEKLFGDGEGSLFIAPRDVTLLVRPRETTDGAVPAGNSVHLMNLLRIARITADHDRQKRAERVVRATAESIELAPSTAAWFLSALDFAQGPSFEVVIAGNDVSAMRRAVFKPFVPNKVVVHRPNGASDITEIAPYVEPQQPIRGRTTAYVCTNYLCRMPVTDPAKVWAAP